MDRIRGPVPEMGQFAELLWMGGKAVLARFDSPALADRLTRSVRHLRCGGNAKPDLIIDCWAIGEDAAIQVPAEWNDSGTFHIERENIELAWDSPNGPLAIYDRFRNRAWMRFGPVDSISSWETATPFRKILHWWAADRSLQLVHAAAIGDSRGGALLVGRSGSGKSTTALACLTGGLGYGGDDYCLVECGSRLYVHSLYLSAKGNAQTATLLPTLRESLTSAPLAFEEKSIVFADDISPSSISTGFPLLAIVVPRITGGEASRLEPLSPAESLRALAPSTLLQLPGQRAAGLARLAELVRGVPSWRLCLGSDPRTAVDVLADLLARNGDPAVS